MCIRIQFPESVPKGPKRTMLKYINTPREWLLHLFLSVVMMQNYVMVHLCTNLFCCLSKGRLKQKYEFVDEIEHFQCESHQDFHRFISAF